MPRKPRQDDEQRQDSAGFEEPHTSQRRRSASIPKQPGNYYDAEHPEVPRVRRASLYLDQITLTEPLDDRPTRSKKLRDLDEDGEIAAAKRSKKQRAINRKLQEDEFDGNEEGADWDEEVVVRKKSRVTTTQRKLPPDTEMPQPVQSRYTPPEKEKFKQPSRRPSLLLIGIIVLVMIIVIPVAAYTTQNNGSKSGPLLIPIGGNSNNTQQKKAADSHTIVITPSDTDHPAPPVFAHAAYLIDANTGATLYASNPFVHLPILSTTKLMTALLAVEHGNLDQKVVITPAIQNDLNQQLSADSSLMGLKRGETYTLRDLLYGAMLVSGNDAAIAIADTIGGNEPHFVAMMNQRAQQLGMLDTHYANPHGLLDPNHYSCAHDLALVARAALSNSMLSQITATKIYHITANRMHPDHYLVNGNQFLWWYPGVDGGKPGWDGNTNFNQVVAVTRNGHRLIGVTLHTNDWWTDMRNLMNWGFDNFNWISPYDVDFQHPIPYDTSWNYFTKDKKENTVPTADHGRYYIFTGYSISGLIMTYYDKNGGFKKFGYPRSLVQNLNSTTQAEKFDHGTIQCDPTTKACKVA